jgi:glycosyltransferase involved in cell wall biosynthesis
MEQQLTVEVVSICGGVGFPAGLAATQTILFTAKALVEAGIPVTVLHCGPNPYLDIRSRTGVYEGIPYRYITCTRRRPVSSVIRTSVYLLSYVELAFRLIHKRLSCRGTKFAVCLHAAGTPLNACVALSCAVLRIPVVIEACEWIPETPGTPRLDCWIYRHITFQLCAGVIVISKTLEDKIKMLDAYRRRPFPLYRRTVLVDPVESGPVQLNPPSDRPILVWCGDVTGYLRDVVFLLSVISKLKQAKCECTLVIVGPYSSESRHTVEHSAVSAGLDPHNVSLLGYVKRPELLQTLRTATAVIVPLWDDVRSKARVPNKVGEYLLSGRPLVTCAIGDIAEYFTDHTNVMFYKAGDAPDCARAIHLLLSNPELAGAIGAAGRVFAEHVLSYHAHGSRLANLFTSVVGSRELMMKDT